jgi:putative oxygen-independent coproporphyrinogen III oxidase
LYTLAIAFSTQDSISIYIHWPFCKSKCPYCDFNSHVTNAINHQDWAAAYLKEISYFKNALAGKTIKSIFFGGGTPSLAEPFIFGEIINALDKYATFAPNIEISMEANPTSVEAKRFAEFKQIGINRISLGIQSLNDTALKFLGREHSSSQAQKAIEIARTTFANYSFDLMYSLPEQTLKEWEKELTTAVKLTGPHMSLYQLTIEKGTPFFKDHRLKKFTMPDENLSADFYELTNELMYSSGFTQYEISNYAKPGFACEHNLVYWRYQDYLGIGPGAHGRYQDADKKYATVMTHAPNAWLALVDEKGVGFQQFEELTATQIHQEKVIMGLRLNEGINRKLIQNKAKLNEFITAGLLEYHNENIRATKAGFLVLNRLILDLLA